MAALPLLAATAQSCHHLDDDRIPPYPVSVSFNNVGDWTTYGVGGALDSRRFIFDRNTNLKIPANFPFTAMSYTGFGGVLLVCDVNNNPVAYDLACPVEVDRDVLIHINDNSHTAVCDKCGSTYDIYTNYGQPLSGIAAERGYGLQRYRVGPGPQGEYMLITRWK